MRAALEINKYDAFLIPASTPTKLHATRRRVQPFPSTSDPPFDGDSYKCRHSVVIDNEELERVSEQEEEEDKENVTGPSITG